jgi:hypothetical protein
MFLPGKSSNAAIPGSGAAFPVATRALDADFWRIAVVPNGALFRSVWEFPGSGKSFLPSGRRSKRILWRLFGAPQPRRESAGAAGDRGPASVSDAVTDSKTAKKPEFGCVGALPEALG